MFDAPPTPLHAESTAYCLKGTMSDGSYTRVGSVASNRHRLGTHITVLGRGGPGGIKRWVVRDRIGWGSDLDFWRPSCSSAFAWGRRHVRYVVGWTRLIASWKPIGAKP